MPTTLAEQTALANERQFELIKRILSDIINDETLPDTLAHTLNCLGISSVDGSSLDQALHAATIYLARLTRQADFLHFKHSQGLHENTVFHVDHHADLWSVEERPVLPAKRDTEVAVSFNRIAITRQASAAISVLPDELTLLANLAEQAGGMIASNGKISVAQWLRFHGVAVPNDKSEVQLLIDALDFATLPARSPLNNYWHFLDTPEDSPYRVTETNRAIIAEQTRHLGQNPSLLAVLGARLSWRTVGPAALSTSVEYRMEGLLEIARQVSSQAQGYREALGGFAEAAEQTPSQALIDQLLIAAMLLELDPELDIACTTFGGFDLYAQRFLLQKPEALRRAFENHLAQRFQLQPLIAPVVAQWVLGGMAPQFLVRDLPPELKVGTPGWVVFCQAVNLVEALRPGASRAMTYEHLLGFSLVPGLLPKLASLQAAHNLDPVVTWALMNDLVERDVNGEIGQQTVNRAIAEYERYVAALTSAINGLNTPVPRRAAMALHEINRRVPGCDPHELLVKHVGTGGGAGRKVSVLDLYLGDELHTTDWGRTRGVDIYRQFPELRDLYPANELYQTAIHEYYSSLTKALSTNIRFALSQLDEADRAFIEQARVAIYQVNQHRPEGFLDTVKPFVSVLNPASGLIPPLTLGAESGRYGVILCAERGRTVRCYELFPLRLHCAFDPALDEQFSFRLIDSRGRWVERKLIPDAPIDIAAYLGNLLPRPLIRTSVNVSKLAAFEPSTVTLTAASPVRYFHSERIAEISHMIAETNTFVSEDELYRIGFDQTDREQAIARTDKVFTVIFNLIIPFKECVEELASGVASRQKNAIAGCIMEAALIAISLVAAPFKVAAVLTKGASMVSKLLSASRVTARTVVALFNPVDGVPQLLKGGGRLIGKSLAKVAGPAMSDFAAAQLHRLTGANRYDLVKAAHHSGSASELRMALDAVDHGRAVFKSDAIETAEQVLKHLHANDRKVLKHIPERELQHLMERSLAEVALKSDSARQLGFILDASVVDKLTHRHAQTYFLESLHKHPDATILPDVLQDTLHVELKNLSAMRAHQEGLLARDLGKAPYLGVMDESRFNPRRLTDNTDRATAWILNASNSQNETEAIRAVLKEYAATSAPLHDPATYKALHRRLVPDAIDNYRSPHRDVRYPSNITGAAMLEKHLAQMDTAHEHFGKHLFGAFLGYHGFSDGNGRMARAIYAITELRKNRFTALDKATENALSGLN